MTDSQNAEQAALKSMDTMAELFAILKEEKAKMKAEYAAILVNANDDQAAAVSKLTTWNWTPVSFNADTGTIEFMRYTETKGKEVGFVYFDGSYEKV